MGKIGKIKPLRYYSEKVLPLVYDDSISYYEVLGKVTRKLNELVDAFNSEVVDIIKESLNKFFVNTVYNSSTETIYITFEEENDG